MQCGSCGAQIGAYEVNCRFCGVVTAYGLHHQHHQQQHQAHLETLEKHHELHGQAQQLASARASIQRTANYALYWGLAGLLFCLCLFPNVMAIVLSFRARTMAKKYGLVLPVNATIALALGVLGILGAGGFVTFGVITDMRKEARIEELEAQLRNASKPTLDQPTACALVEKRLLKKGFGGDSSIQDFDCPGKLQQDGTRATLESVRFEASSKDRTVRACLEYGALWSVMGFRLDAACSEPDDTETQDSASDEKRKATGAAASLAASASAEAEPASSAAAGGAGDSTKEAVRGSKKKE